VWWEPTLDWDDENVEHLARHGVTPEEGAQALSDPRRVGVSAYNAEEERRWAVLGASEDGRILFVVFTRRRGRIRVVTARDATLRERRSYRR